MAADDVAYSQHPEKANWEYRTLARVFEHDQSGIHQGIFVATPTGRLIAMVNAGWPDPDPGEVFRRIKAAVAEYKSIPRSERVISPLPDPVSGRLKFEIDSFAKPGGTLDLRVTKRGYAYPGMTTFDERHPKYFGIDRLWFKPSEFKQYLPRDFRVGATTTVVGAPMQRWLLHNHMQKACSAWDVSQISHAVLTSTITKLSGSLVDIEIRGEFAIKADTQWNSGSYSGNLLGRATFDRDQGQFTAWESVMLGRATLGKLLPNAHAGDLTQAVASYATINPHLDKDDDMVPSDWKYGYGLDWCRRP